MSDRTPRPRAVLRHVLLALLLGAASAAHAQWAADGALDASDPIYHRPYLFEGSCELSSIGTQVHWDAFELILDAPVPSDLSAGLCNAGTGFDTVLYFYQHADARPGPFAAHLPCQQLVAYNDDACGGSQSSIVNQPLDAGYVTVVVTSFANGTLGDYHLDASSLTAALGDFVFYSGFELGSARSWSFVLP